MRFLFCSIIASQPDIQRQHCTADYTVIYIIKVV
jgi:hypothetical protein